MTTIATDGETMAADGLSTVVGTIVRTKCRKILRLPDGSLFGGAGDSGQIATLYEWLCKPVDERGDYPQIKEVAALVLRRDGTALVFDNLSNGHGDDVEFPMAIGSGEQYALTAMDAGATPEEAIRIASKRDPHTGGEIQVEYFIENEV
jgi:ATP-dependent protease HslVU (ClpYQ) peptidase subunit